MSQEHIRCGMARRDAAGSCNACQRRDEDMVLIVDLNTLTFRLCRQCAKWLASELTKQAGRKAQP